jgi:transposase
LKGYLTNTTLPAKDVCEQYSELWVIERAYRITKGTLEMRPMFHFTPNRIEAHVCICFIAYKVYKELERVLKLKNINLSADKVLNIAKTITTLKIKLPISGEAMTKTMSLTNKHRSRLCLTKCSGKIFKVTHCRSQETVLRSAGLLEREKL